MINNYETPIEFDVSKNIDGIEVFYINLMEISQGGPEVGTILINGKKNPDYRFGGPFLKDGNYLYAPVLIRKFIGVGFKLAEINLINLNVSLIGGNRSLIFIEKIVDNQFFFYEDLNKIKCSTYDLTLKRI